MLVSLGVFLLFKLLPGNAADALAGASGSADATLRATLEAELGLDQPWWRQYLSWMASVFRGEGGYSLIFERPVSALILPRLPITGLLAALALGWAVCVGVPLGLLCALRPHGVSDALLRLGGLIGLALPAFWLGMLALLGVLALSGRLWIYPGAQAGPGAIFAALLLPAAVVGLRSAALLMRITRAALLEIRGADYLRTAAAKGLAPARMWGRHALINAAPSILSAIALEASLLVGGLVVTETVFNVPGVGRLLIDALRWRDEPLALTLVLCIAVAVALLHHAADLLQRIFDPRLRDSSALAEEPLL